MSCGVALCLSSMFHVMHLLLPLPAFIHLHRASHLGALDEPREGCDVGAEPEDGVWWTYPKDGRTEQVLGWEMLTEQVSSNKH